MRKIKGRNQLPDEQIRLVYGKLDTLIKPLLKEIPKINVIVFYLKIEHDLTIRDIGDITGLKDSEVEENLKFTYDLLKTKILENI